MPNNSLPNTFKHTARDLVLITANALKRGSYVKTIGCLGKIRDDEQELYCVLGAFCNEAVKMGLPIKKRKGANTKAIYFDDYYNQLPIFLSLLLQTNGSVTFCKESTLTISLDKLNDSTDYSLSFIGQIIEDWRHVIFPKLFNESDKVELERRARLQSWRFGHNYFYADGKIQLESDHYTVLVKAGDYTTV